MESKIDKIYTPDPNGLYEKYIVNTVGGEPLEGPVFVLRPFDPHARVALRAYASSVESENPTLAHDLRELANTYSNKPIKYGKYKVPTANPKWAERFYQVENPADATHVAWTTAMTPKALPCEYPRVMGLMWLVEKEHIPYQD